MMQNYSLTAEYIYNYIFYKFGLIGSNDIEIFLMRK